MSKTLLDALKRHNLQGYYPTFHNRGITYVDILDQVGANDYSKLGLRSTEDKTKFRALFEDLSEKLSTNNTAPTKVMKKSPVRNESSVNRKYNLSPSHSNYSTTTSVKQETTTYTTTIPLNSNTSSGSSSNNNNTLPLKKESLSPKKNGITIPVTNNGYKIPTESDRIEPITSRKRPVPLHKIPPEKRARRMTIAPTTQRTPLVKPANSVRDRRLSYLPRERLPLVNRSPTRPGAGITKPNPPSSYKQFKRPKVLDEPMEQQPIINDRPSTRLLDAYGVPITSNRQHQAPKSNEITKSLEDFLLSKSKANAVSTTPTSTPYNELHQRIRVCVRKRPLSKKELTMQETDIVPMVGSRTIQLNAPKTRIDLVRYTETHTFTFDDAFDCNTTNEEIYARTAQPLVEYIFEGGKATCFAHGQTGSGKTYTMLDPNHGLYVLAAHDIFRLLSKPKFAHLSASVGFYEIYQGQLYDLLNLKEKLTARDDGNNNVVIAGLREHPISDVDQLMSIFEYGNQGRTTGQTGANETSSRSHAVLQVLLKTKDNPAKVFGKLSFIDLAGSERGADRGDADTKTRLEGAEINKSLLALKECIRALDQDQKHTPFRGSKLTQVLRDSFIGNSRTCMIATISPNNSNSEHTLNTLRYADRVKQLRGESDPRISNSVQPMSSSSFLDEDDAETTSITSYGENENLLEVDCPTSVTTNLLATPTNNRFLPPTLSSTSSSASTSDRQRNYLRRLESPPAEVFSSNTIIADPFYSKPLQKPDANMDSTMSRLEISNNNNNKNNNTIDSRQVNNFLEFHRKQLQQFNECIRTESNLIARLSLSLEDFPNDAEESEQSKSDYEEYLNRLEDVVDRKAKLVDIMRKKIRDQYQEE